MKIVALDRPRKKKKEIITAHYSIQPILICSLAKSNMEIKKKKMIIYCKDVFTDFLRIDGERCEIFMSRHQNSRRSFSQTTTKPPNAICIQLCQIYINFLSLNERFVLHTTRDLILLQLHFVSVHQKFARIFPVQNSDK